MNKQLAIENSIKKEFQFLIHQYNYELRQYTAPSIRHRNFSVFEYNNKTYNRLIELRYQILDSGFVNFFAVFKRIPSHGIPNHQDNINHLTFNRLTTYYEKDKNEILDRYQKDVIAKIEFCARLIKKNNEYLNNHSWFSHERLIKNEKKQYLFDRDWKPEQWILDTINTFKEKFGHRFSVTHNSDDIEPYEIPESSLSLTDTITQTCYTFHYGWESRDTSVLKILIQDGNGTTTKTFKDPNIKTIVDVLLSEL